MKEVNLDYTTFKTLVASKGLLMQYLDENNVYNIFASEGNVAWQCFVNKDGGANQTDFETNYKPTANQNVNVGILPAPHTLDLFSRNRISNPVSLFASQFLYDKQPLLWDELLVGGGTSTFNSNTSSVSLAVTTTSGDRVVRQTKEYFAYEPDRAQQTVFSVVFGTGTANCTQNVGTFDDNDGVFIQLNGTTFGAVIRSSTSGSAVDSITTQANFNIDPLDGTGPSKVVLDVTKAQLFIIEYQWFGVGTVRFGLFYNSQIYYFHQVFHANLVTQVYMKRGSLPLRFEIKNTAAISGAVILTQICAAMQSEAGYTPTGINFSANTGTSGRSITNGATLPILSITLNSTKIRATIVPISFSILGNAANNLYYQIILNGSLTGSSFSSVNTNSVAEYDISATAISGGTVLDSGYVSSVNRQTIDTQVQSLLKVAATIGGTADIVSLVLTNIVGDTNTFYAAMSWQEYV
jgi:hypothetical protein